MDVDHRKRARRVVVRSVPIVGAGFVAIAGVVILYLKVPVPSANDPTWAIIVSLTAVGLLYVAVAFWLVVKINAAKHPLTIGAIAISVLVTALVALFALSYVSLSQTDPTNFNVPLDKVSSLYFTVTILATVGFGDIHAVSHTAMIVVMLQMVAGLTLFTVVARVLVSVVRDATKRKWTGPSGSQAPATSTQAPASNSQPPASN